MVNPIKYTLKDAIMYVYILETDSQVEGQLKLEIFEDYVMAHPTLFYVTKTSFERFKEMFKKACKDMKSLHFDFVHTITDNHKLVRMLTDKQAKGLIETPQGVLYEYGV